jgi:microcystin-dependent protein
MSWYRAGTVTVTNGSKTVTGVGTLFTTAVNAGDAFALVDANLNPTGAWYEVEAVTNNTTLVLKQSYAGSTGSNKQYCVFNLVGNMTTPSFAQRLATFFASFQSLIDKPTTTPTAASIPVADENGDIDSGWIKDTSATVKGVVKVGSNISVAEGTISVPEATEAVKGVVEVGSNISVANGVISVPEASETVKGVVELATSAEVLAGEDDERVVTPKGLSDWSKTPVGTIVIYPVDSVPAHCLECNGATISRATYSELFAAIGTTYGEGDGSTTFNLPDFRDRFLRGAGGTNAGAIGTAQGDAIRNITGRITIDPFNGAAAICRSPIGAFESVSPFNTYYANSGGTTNGNTVVAFDASNVVPTAAENRPVNYAVKFCIVYE